MDTADEQFMILMHETNTPLHFDSAIYSPGLKYGYQNANLSAGKGSLSVSKLCKLLPDAGLLHLDLRGNVTLTERGHAFAEWLIKRGHKTDFFETPIGGWGTRPDGFEAFFTQRPPQPIS